MHGIVRPYRADSLLGIDLERGLKMCQIFNSHVLHIPARDFIDFPALNHFSDKEAAALVKLLCKTRGIPVVSRKSDYGLVMDTEPEYFQNGVWYRYEKTDGRWLFTGELTKGEYLSEQEEEPEEEPEDEYTHSDVYRYAGGY